MLLLDTNALMWFALGDNKLSAKARSPIEQKLGREGVGTSVLSIWEFGDAAGHGHIRIKGTFAEVRQASRERGIVEHELTPAAVMDALGLENLSSDPFDRLIVATARTLRATLVTSDRKILAWRGSWIGWMRGGDTVSRPSHRRLGRGTRPKKPRHCPSRPVPN